MAAVLIRDLAPETHRALRARARKNGRSVSAEIRAVLDESVRPSERVKVGTELARFGKRYADELALVDFDSLRDKTPATGVDFSGPEFDLPE